MTICLRLTRGLRAASDPWCLSLLATTKFLPAIAGMEIHGIQPESGQPRKLDQ